MSYSFKKEIVKEFGVNGLDLRNLELQKKEVIANRNESIDTMVDLGKGAGIIAANDSNVTINQKVGEMYREIDNTPMFERKAVGSHALLQRLLTGAQTVNLGKKVIESRTVGEAGKANISMSGQKSIVMDHTESSYQKAVVPIFDAGFGRDFRDVLASQSEAFDGISEDSREVEWTLFDKVNSYLWNGDASIAHDGTSWLGLKADPSIATATPALNFATSSDASAIVNGLLALVSVLKIDNNCTGPYSLGVSREIYMNWMKITSTSDRTFGNIMNTVMAFVTEIGEIYEDSSLTGNQLFMAVIGRDALHAKSGMAMSSYALPRVKHNDNYDFVKWCAFGFMAKNTKAGKKCAVYAA